MATLEEITARIKQGVGEDSGLGRSLAIDFKGEGFIHIEGGEVSNDDKPADCTLVMTKDNFENLAMGRLDPATAMFSGKLKIKGDMAVALKLKTLFDRARG